MSVVRQQKWVFCLQIEEVRETERENLRAAFQGILATYVAIDPTDQSIYIECERTHYDAWDMRCCTEAWFDAEAIAALPARLEDLMRQAYPGPASNITTWNGPALASPSFGVRPGPQFRDVEI